MAKVLLINPNRWGRGITAIWIPSHTASLRVAGHEVDLFDGTFYSSWSNDEVNYNTSNKQYKPSEYSSHIHWSKNDIYSDLQQKIDHFKPDLILCSALSSHIHGEGEYVNIQYGHLLLSRVKTLAIKVAGGLQVMANPGKMFELFPHIDMFVRGESDLAICELANKIKTGDFSDIKGLVYKTEEGVRLNAKQQILTELDLIPPYDYSLFSEQMFYRPYNGEVLKAVDYELSRGCLYTCTYCVETIIQRYYGFTERNERGILKGFNHYLRNKSAKRVFEELTDLYTRYEITLIRCQDTNFLSIDREMLNELAGYMEASDLPIKLYIETRPDGINSKNIELLKRLKVDGIGMGVEIAAQDFCEDELKRFASGEDIINAFSLLKQANIKRTAYNIIGLPDEDENMILQTIQFNTLLQPDNVTVAFYSPYQGTEQQLKATSIGDFNDYEMNVDGQVRTLSKSTKVSRELLEFYKKHFVSLVFDDVDNEHLKELKISEGIRN